MNATSLKACILVITVAIVVFAIGKPLFMRFISAEDFARRRNLWLLLVSASFLAPNIWLYILVAVPAIVIATSRDSNPAALYLFVLLAVPPVRVEIPTLGLVGQVFAIDHPRLLSIALLLPVAFTLRQKNHLEAATQRAPGSPSSAWSLIDALLVSFVVLQVVLILPYDSFTSLARRAVLLGLDILLPYFVISRLCRTRGRITEAMAAFVLAMVVLTPLAIYEFFRGWMIFAIVGEDWNAGHMYFPLYRGPFLRAQATAGHSIFLGYFMAMALGMWLYLQRAVPLQKGWRWLCSLGLLAGLIVSLSRGPWVGAAAMLVTFLVLGPNARSRSLRGAALAAAVVGALVLSPWGSDVAQYLPFVGSIDEHTVVYRQQLAMASWSLIQQNPFFGSFSFLKNLEEFRTGEGIIDLVNTYAIVGLTYGLVGVALFVSVFLAAMWKMTRLVRQLAATDADVASLGSAMVACVAGTLLILATTSFLHSMPYFVWAFVGFADAYVRSVSEELGTDRLVRTVGDAYPQVVR